MYFAGSKKEDKGEYDLPPVYLIGLLGKVGQDCFNRDGEEWTDRFISEYTFREKGTGRSPKRQ